MDEIRQYLLSLIAAAVMCGVVHGIFGNKGTYGSLLRLLTGIVMLITLLAPISRIRIPDIASLPESFAEDARRYTEAGTEAADQAKAAIIKSQTEAYILDKAASMEVDICVEVVMSEDSEPVAVMLQGSVSPYEKQLLESQIEAQLGIARENQQWK